MAANVELASSKASLVPFALFSRRRKTWLISRDPNLKPRVQGGFDRRDSFRSSGTFSLESNPSLKKKLNKKNYCKYAAKRGGY